MPKKARAGWEGKVKIRCEVSETSSARRNNVSLLHPRWKSQRPTQKITIRCRSSRPPWCRRSILSGETDRVPANQRARFAVTRPSRCFLPSHPGPSVPLDERTPKTWARACKTLVAALSTMPKLSLPLRLNTLRAQGYHISLRYTSLGSTPPCPIPPAKP